MGSAQDTIAAIATPLGEGGLGIIRLSGPKAIDVIDAFFVARKKIPLSTAPTHTCHVGTLLITPSPLEGEGRAGGKAVTTNTSNPPSQPSPSRGEGAVIDEAVVTLFRAPNSYTGEDVVEISAHGSPFVLQQILQQCFRHGARAAEPGEFTQRAFLSGKIDLTQAEAVAELIRAKTEKTHHAAIAQLKGHLAGEIRSLRDQLLPLIAHVEVGLDHSDEDHDFLHRERLIKQCTEIRERLDAILASARVGKILREGLRVALVGRPNVGKSSLLNALLKEDRAIVTPVAGTTRDTLEETVHWNGLSVVLTDTAGLRESSSDPIEKLGMSRTHDALDRADLVLGLFDGSEDFSDEDHAVIQTCTKKPHLWLVTKRDLPTRWPAGHFVERHGPIIGVSAKTGEGLATLIQAVEHMALGEQASSASADWMLNARHVDALTRARTALHDAATAAQTDTFEECVALELRTALQSLGEIIGETPTEDLLGQIFSQFCVGK